VIVITSVKVVLHTGDKIRGYATVTIDDSFVVRGIKIIQGDDGRLFTAMPSRKRSDGTYQDFAHPILPEARALLEEAVQAEYLAMLRAEAQVCFRQIESQPKEPQETHAARELNGG
jgi:stage V sporulation protein G